MSEIELFRTVNYYKVIGLLVIVAFVVLSLIAAFSLKAAWLTFQTVLIVALIAKIVHDRSCHTSEFE